MAREIINVGTNANDSTGDPLRTAFQKLNNMTAELYTDDASDVNSIVATAPIARNNATGIVTISLNDAGIVTDKIADDAVTTDKLANAINSAITANTAKVTNATHTGDVTGSGALTIVDDKVITSKILDANVTTAKIADDAVTADKLANSINSEIAANTAKTGITSGQASAITANTSKVTNATHTGDVTGSGALTIANDAVTIDKIADAVIVTASEGIGSNDNDTTIPTSAATKAYVDNSASGGISVSVITGNTNAASGNLYVLTANLTLTLPSSPSAGNYIKISNRSGVATCVVARNSEKIMGVTTDLTLDKLNSGFEMVYSGTAQGWVLIGVEGTAA